jgi:hypothetical protein
MPTLFLLATDASSNEQPAALLGYRIIFPGRPDLRSEIYNFDDDEDDDCPSLLVWQAAFRTRWITAPELSFQIVSICICIAYSAGLRQSAKDTTAERVLQVWRGALSLHLGKTYRTRSISDTTLECQRSCESIELLGALLLFVGTNHL